MFELGLALNNGQRPSIDNTTKPTNTVRGYIDKKLEKWISKIKIWSMETVDMSMLSNSHPVNFLKKYS